MTDLSAVLLANDSLLVDQGEYRRGLTCMSSIAGSHDVVSRFWEVKMESLYWGKASGSPIRSRTSSEKITPEK